VRAEVRRELARHFRPQGAETSQLTNLSENRKHLALGIFPFFGNNPDTVPVRFLDLSATQ
jgi:hypothetical protein